MKIVETKLDPNTTLIPTDPTTLRIYKNAPITVGVIMSGDAGGKAGLEFQFGDVSFFFSTRLEYNGFTVGPSPTSFDDADSNATSTQAELKVGHLDVIANYIGNSGSINVGPR